MIKITIPGRPSSLNHAKAPCRVNGKMRLIASKEGRLASKMLEYALLPYKKELIAFGKTIDRTKVGIAMEYTFFYRPGAIKTKNGELSFSVPDIDNSFKAIKDQIFKMMGLNDGLVVHLCGEKMVGEDERVEIVIFETYLPWIKEELRHEAEKEKTATTSGGSTL